MSSLKPSQRSLSFDMIFHQRNYDFHKTTKNYLNLSPLIEDWWETIDRVYGRDTRRAERSH